MQQFIRWVRPNETKLLTNPSMHGDSLRAPQQPRKPTTIIRAPAAMRMYTPERHTHTHTQKWKEPPVCPTHIMTHRLTLQDNCGTGVYWDHKCVIFLVTWCKWGYDSCHHCHRSGLHHNYICRLTPATLMTVPTNTTPVPKKLGSCVKKTTTKKQWFANLIMFFTTEHRKISNV